jgi:hypothetical protein
MAVCCGKTNYFFLKVIVPKLPFNAVPFPKGASTILVIKPFGEVA